MRRVSTYRIGDFTGGLNVVADAAHLAQNETSDCLNVRLLPQGGLQIRSKLGTVGTKPSDANLPIRNMWPYYGSSALIVQQTNNNIRYKTETASWTTVTLTGTTTGRMRAATMARASAPTTLLNYIQRNTENAPLKFTGTAATALTDAATGWNENLAAPAGGKMPFARFVTEHAGYLFHGATKEGGVSYEYRVRWSHPNEPEDYRENDWVDVGVDDGDPITGLCSYQSQLFIFKTRSIWVLSGYDPDTFQLRKIADEVGAVNQEAIAPSPFGIFFVDSARGVFVIRPGGESPKWLFEKLFYYLSQEYIPRTFINNATCGWFDSRLFVALPWYEWGGDANTRMFVFDPQLGRDGAWYPYEYGTRDAPVAFGPMMSWRPSLTTSLNLAVGVAVDPANPTATLQFAHTYAFSGESSPSSAIATMTETARDRITSGGTGAYFTSYFKTSWVDARMPGVTKRWRRPQFLFDADYDALLGVQCYRDYLSSQPRAVFEYSVTGSGVATTSSPAATWNSFKWGEARWGQSATSRAIPQGDQTLVRGSALGRANAVALRFESQQCNWGLNAIDFRYIPKKVR